MEEIVLRLNTPEELFQAQAADVLSARGRLFSGIEELMLELTPRRLNDRTTVVIALPRDQLQPDTRQRLSDAIERYCTQRLRQTELLRRAQWREVMAAFRTGFVIFAFGVLLSYYFNHSGLATLTKLLLGDGFFLVIAWVGLWYPLDTLVHYRRQSAREERVLRAIRTMEVRVGSSDDAAAALPEFTKTTAPRAR